MLPGDTLVCSCAHIGDKFLMSFANDKISTLAKLLEPYFRQQIREQLGPLRAKNLNAKTYVQGGEFHQEDLSGGYTGEDAVNLQDDKWDESEDETAQAERSVTVTGFGGLIEPAAKYSVVWGWGGKCYKNPCSVSAGFQMYDMFESQAARYTESSKVTVSSSWQTIGSIYLREFTHALAMRPNDMWNTAGIHAYISGIEIGAQRSYAYKVIATTKLRNGTITLLQSAVTTLYETDTNFDLQVVVNDTTDALDFQVKDSGNSGRSVKWCVHARTSEAIGASDYHQYTEC